MSTPSETSPKTSELPKVYDPKSVEASRYAHWRDSGYFKPRGDDSAPSYTMILPPPNVTGRLHMGHALTATIEDSMLRWHRMREFRALWVPGTDHAGIATQVMVERQIAKEGKDRLSMGRDAFLERVWEWKEEHSGAIDEQHRILGASMDWDRYRFTMDEVSSKAVREAFCRLYEEGKIYRDYRLINWDSVSQTALSDLEVDHKEVEGALWHLAYPVVGSDDKLVVATTRPETMLGDTAVAVHPEDPRYKHLIGQKIALPLTNREIPIVGDDILVDMEFGTGAVKVTPAHDFNDFETGKRHKLELICIIDTEGKICDPAPARFVGLSVKEARKAVVDELDKAGVLVKKEAHKMNVGTSQRTGVVVEPLPSHQWFVDVGSMAALASKAVRSGETKIYPAPREADFHRWMDNIHDWCISRQLWWGHRIPAWYCQDCENITVDRQDPSACAKCGSTNIVQDEDVLDTWFSSGLWPLTTLGWPEQSEDLKNFYPLSLMETGWDILFFWVARMMMFGCHFTGKSPFASIFLHSMVLGEDKQKMSKTKGNVVDPLELVEQYGTDALRFYLATMAGQDTGIVFSRARVEGYRNFCNKLWNAARFVMMNLDGFERKEIDVDNIIETSPFSAWILGRAWQVAQEVNARLSEYRFDLAAHALYQFSWYEFCDWYLELAKGGMRDENPEVRYATQQTLVTTLDMILRMLHPTMPFITEEIWQKLPRRSDDAPSLMYASFPGAGLKDSHRKDTMWKGWDGLDEKAVVKSAMDFVSSLTESISAARMLKAECRISPAQKVDLILRIDDVELAKNYEQYRSPFQRLGRLGEVTVVAAGTEVPRESAAQVCGAVEVILPLAGLVDLEEERKRLAKEVTAKQKELGSLSKKLGNQGFLAKAPPEVVEKEKAREIELRSALDKQKALLERLGGAV